MSNGIFWHFFFFSVIVFTFFSMTASASLPMASLSVANLTDAVANYTWEMYNYISPPPAAVAAPSTSVLPLTAEAPSLLPASLTAAFNDDDVEEPR